MEDWKELLERAEQSLLRDRPQEALQFCARASFGTDEGRYRAALMRGRILLEIGDPLGALSSFESIARLDSPDPQVDCARGIALFELAQFPEAQAALRAALRGDPNLPDAHYTLGLLSEFLGTGEEEHWFREARRLDPLRFPPCLQMTNEAFEVIIQEAVSELEEPVQKALEEVPIVVAELPLVNDLHQLDPQISPLALSMTVGTILEGDPENEIQPVLFLFKRNVERAFGEREQMVAATRAAIASNFEDGFGVTPQSDLEDSAEGPNKPLRD